MLTLLICNVINAINTNLGDTVSECNFYFLRCPEKQIFRFFSDEINVKRQLVILATYVIFFSYLGLLSIGTITWGS